MRDLARLSSNDEISFNADDIMMLCDHMIKNNMGVMSYCFLHTIVMCLEIDVDHKWPATKFIDLFELLVNAFEKVSFVYESSRKLLVRMCYVLKPYIVC